MLTVVVVFPTPPFWLLMVMIRVLFGFGSSLPRSFSRRLVSLASSRPRGEESSIASMMLLPLRDFRVVGEPTASGTTGVVSRETTTPTSAGSAIASGCVSRRPAASGYTAAVSGSDFFAGASLMVTQ